MDGRGIVGRTVGRSDGRSSAREHMRQGGLLTGQRSIRMVSSAAPTTFNSRLTFNLVGTAFIRNDYRPSLPDGLPAAGRVGPARYM